jgi:phage-related protein
MDKWRVIFYISSNGGTPIKEFLDARPKAKSKAIRILSNIEEFGLSSVIPHVKKLTGTPLWEIRVLGEDSIRILYVVRMEKKVLLLHGFIKKTNKTPAKEISLALSRLKEIED